MLLVLLNYKKYYLRSELLIGIQDNDNMGNGYTQV